MNDNDTTKCSYCGDIIPEGHYVLKRYTSGLVKGYCCFECKHRAETLRMTVRNPKKYKIKHLNETDKR